MNYYPFHIGDYLSATRHLSWDEDTAYRRLLDTYYTTEMPLPADFRACYRLVLATTDEQREAVKVVLQEFFVETPDGWINARADREIDAMREKQQKQRDRANKRWQKPVAEHGNASAMPRHGTSDATASEIDASAMPPTPTPTPTPTPIKNSVVSPSAPPADRGSRLPTDWTAPTDWITWCRQNRPDLDPVLIAEQFRDFWLAKPGKDGRKSDWFATWRNWCRGQKTGPGRRGDDASDWTRSAA